MKTETNTTEIQTPKHTLGPWKKSMSGMTEYLCYIQGSPEGTSGVMVGTVHHLPPAWGDAKANANLICAAPELLAACKAFAGSGWLENCPDKLRDAVLSAIAKAEGAE